MSNTPERKDSSIALILSIVLGIFGLAGIGQIYMGRTGLGIALTIVGIILLASMFFTFFITGVLYLVIFVYAVWHTHKLTKEQ